MYGLTDYDDCVNVGYCVFSTILLAQFYINTGSVSGSGQATMRFPGANTGGRRLGDGSRKLQEAEPPTLSEFDLSVTANAVTDGPGALATGSGSAALGFTVTVAGLIACSLFND